MENRDPTVDDPNCRGWVISKVSFEELVRVFPTAQVKAIFFFFFRVGHSFIYVYIYTVD